MSERPLVKIWNSPASAANIAAILTLDADREPMKILGIQMDWTNNDAGDRFGWYAVFFQGGPGPDFRAVPQTSIAAGATCRLVSFPSAGICIGSGFTMPTLTPVGCNLPNMPITERVVVTFQTNGAAFQCGVMRVWTVALDPKTLRV